MTLTRSGRKGRVSDAPSGNAERAATDSATAAPEISGQPAAAGSDDEDELLDQGFLDQIQGDMRSMQGGSVQLRGASHARATPSLLPRGIRKHSVKKAGGFTVAVIGKSLYNTSRSTDSARSFLTACSSRQTRKPLTAQK